MSTIAWSTTRVFNKRFTSVIVLHFACSLLCRFEHMCNFDRFCSKLVKKSNVENMKYMFEYATSFKRKLYTAALRQANIVCLQAHLDRYRGVYVLQRVLVQRRDQKCYRRMPKIVPEPQDFLLLQTSGWTHRSVGCISRARHEQLVFG